MSERLTDRQVAQFAKLVEAARAEGDPDGPASHALQSYLDNHVKQIADELVDLRYRERSFAGFFNMSTADRARAAKATRPEIDGLNIAAQLLRREIEVGNEPQEALDRAAKWIDRHLGIARRSP